MTGLPHKCTSMRDSHPCGIWHLCPKKAKQSNNRPQLQFLKFRQPSYASLGLIEPQVFPIQNKETNQECMLVNNRPHAKSFPKLHKLVLSQGLREDIRRVHGPLYMLKVELPRLVPVFHELMMDFNVFSVFSL
jgi:hypothetical protein